MRGISRFRMSGDSLAWQQARFKWHKCIAESTPSPEHYLSRGFIYALGTIMLFALDNVVDQVKTGSEVSFNSIYTTVFSAALRSFQLVSEIINQLYQAPGLKRFSVGCRISPREISAATWAARR